MSTRPMNDLERGDEVSIRGSNDGGRYVADVITVTRNMRGRVRTQENAVPWRLTATRGSNFQTAGMTRRRSESRSRTPVGPPAATALT